MNSYARVAVSMVTMVVIALSGTSGVGAADDAKAPTGDDQAAALTTVIILRHAEKAGDSGNVHLSYAGKERARALAKVCGSSGLVALYGVTNEGHDLRVRETLQPIADFLKLEPKIMMIPNPFHFRVLRHDIRTNYSGKAILVVSHSDKIEKIIRTLGGDETRCSIGEDFDNLCVVTMCAPSSVNVLKLKYGTTK